MLQLVRRDRRRDPAVGGMAVLAGKGQGFILPFGPALRPETQCRRKTSGSKERIHPEGQALSLCKNFLHSFFNIPKNLTLQKIPPHLNFSEISK